MHLAKIAAVALVENYHHALLKDRMVLVLLDEDGEFLDGGDYYAIIVIAAAFVPVFKLSLKHCGRSIAVRRSFFESIVLLHRLVVQVLSVHHKEHFVNVGQS